MSLLIQPAREVGYHFSLNGEKLSSRIHPINEGKRIFSRRPFDSLNSPMLFIGFFPVYPIRAYLESLNRPLELSPEVPPETPPENLLFGILENRPLDATDIKKLLYHVGIKHPTWQEWILRSWLRTTSDVETFLTSCTQSPTSSQTLPLKLSPKKLSPKKLSPKKLSPKKLSPLEALGKLNVLVSPYARKQDSNLFKQIFHTFKERTLKSHHTESYFSPIWVLNTLQNLSLPQSDIFFIDSCVLSQPSPPPASNMAKKGRSTRTPPTPPLSAPSPPTALIVMSGLSSERHLGSLQDHAKSYPVFSALGMFPLLKHHGIPVQAMIGTDPGFYNRLHLTWERDPQYRTKDLSQTPASSPLPPLFAPLTLAASIPRSYETLAKVFYYIDDLKLWEHCRSFFMSKTTPPSTSPIPPIPFIPMDASLSLSAIRLLATLGYKRILTYGMDFTLTPFKAHVQGYSLEEHCFTQHTRLKPYETLTQSFFHSLKPARFDKTRTSETLPNKQPRSLYSDTKLELYHTAYQNLLTTLQHPPQTALNPQTTGIEILPGETVRPLSPSVKNSQPPPLLKILPRPYSRKDLKTQIYQYFTEQESIYKEWASTSRVSSTNSSTSREKNRDFWIAKRFQRLQSPR